MARISAGLLILLTLFLSNNSRSELTPINPWLGDRPVPESRWHTARFVHANAALNGTRPDLIVIPVQGGDNSFDPIERSLITRLVVDRASEGMGISVADPSLLIKAFGLHMQSFDSSAINRLVNNSETRSALILTANHDRNGKFELTARLHGSEKARTWSDLTYTDEQPPHLTLLPYLDEIVEFATGRVPAKAATERSSSESQQQLPESAEKYISESARSSLQSAKTLQFLGMLHPDTEFDETRNFLFERSLIALRKVSSDQPEHRYLVARAYTYLDRRPVAIEALGEPRTVQETVLLEYLNGNFGRLQKHAEKAEPSLSELFFWRRFLPYEYDYLTRQQQNLAESYAELHPAWDYAFDRALSDHNAMRGRSAAELLVWLHSFMQVDTESLNKVVGASLLRSGTVDEIDLARATLAFTSSVREQLDAGWATDASVRNAVTALDFAELAETILLADHWRRVETNLAVRVLAEPALKQLNEFESIFANHPALTLQKARALRLLAKNLPDQERNNLAAEAWDLDRRGLVWSGLLSTAALEIARRRMTHVPSKSNTVTSRKDDEIAVVIPYRHFEWPKSSNYYAFGIETEHGFGGFFDGCLKYRAIAFGCLSAKIEIEEQEHDDPIEYRLQLLERHAHRFVGSVSRDAFELKTMRLTGSVDDEIVFLQRRIESNGGKWRDYEALGKNLKRQGRLREAAETFLQFPDFDPPEGNLPFGVDNQAIVAGSWFYWTGDFELAEPLLELAAKSGTGSEANYQGIQRRALIAGDLQTATQYALRRVQRYASDYGARDFLSLLHIQGESEYAWPAFDQLLPSMKRPEIWTSALVGHRKIASTDEEIRLWAEKTDNGDKLHMSIRSEIANTWLFLGQKLLLLNASTDRRPNDELESMLSSLPRGGQIHFMAPEFNAKYDSRRAFGYALGNGFQYHDANLHLPANPPHTDQSPVKIERRYEMLARPVTSFARRDYTSANLEFDNIARFYYLDEYLPYYAFSAAVTGKHQHITAALKAREPALNAIRATETPRNPIDGYRFDEDLAYAVLAGFEGNHAASVRLFRKALSDRPYLVERTVFPYYAVVDLADRMFEETGQEVYKELALDLARRHTVVLPMYSWAYFVVAKHSPSNSERVEFGATGFILDELSARGNELPRKVQTRARKFAEEHGPTLLQRSKSSEREQT